jgi:hypothetical protein
VCHYTIQPQTPHTRSPQTLKLREMPWNAVRTLGIAHRVVTG